MAVQSSFYVVDGSTRTFPSTKHIATKQHCMVSLKLLSSGLWQQADIGTYSLINNSIIFSVAPLQSTYSDIEIRVADTDDELLGNPSDIAIIAMNIDNINIVADNVDSVITVADALTNGGSVSVGGGQFLGSAPVKGVQYMAQSTSEVLTVPANTNAFSVGPFTINNGGAINVPDNSIYKIL